MQHFNPVEIVGALPKVVDQEADLQCWINCLRKLLNVITPG